MCITYIALQKQKVILKLLFCIAWKLSTSFLILSWIASIVPAILNLTRHYACVHETCRQYKFLISVFHLPKYHVIMPFHLFGKYSYLFLSRQFSANNGSVSLKSRAPFLLAAMPVISFGLGTWQVYRLQWKKSLIQQLEDRTMKEPLEITDRFVLHLAIWEVTRNPKLFMMLESGIQNPMCEFRHSDSGI